MRRRALGTLVLLLALSPELMAAERPYASLTNHRAMGLQWGSAWGGALNAMLGGRILLDRTSSQPKGLLSRVYDGNPGSLADPTGSFLIFDTSHAAFRIIVPQWRQVDSLTVYTLEAARGDHGSIRATFLPDRGPARGIRFVRTVVGTKNAMVHVRYRSESVSLGVNGGEFKLLYDCKDFGSAFVGEISLDEIGNDPAGMPQPPATTASRLLFWEHSDPAPVTLHSFIIQRARTGAAARDLVPAWLALPAVTPPGGLPLVVLVPDSQAPFPALEALGFGRPEYAVAARLAASGLAVLLIDVAQAELTEEEASLYLQGIHATLEQLASDRFVHESGLQLDAARFGIWGQGRGALLAMRLASADDRFKRVAITNRSASVHVPEPGTGSDRVRVMKTALDIPTDAMVGAAAAFLMGSSGDSLDAPEAQANATAFESRTRARRLEFERATQGR